MITYVFKSDSDFICVKIVQPNISFELFFTLNWPVCQLLSQVCSDPCCNASSCQLVEGAECFSGGCCNECKFRPYGFVCRGSTQECDITDYCSGKMSECPEDARIQNGQNCNNNISYCYSGVCTSNDAMCQIYFSTYHTGSSSITVKHYAA